MTHPPTHERTYTHAHKHAGFGLRDARGVFKSGFGHIDAEAGSNRCMHPSIHNMRARAYVCILILYMCLYSGDERQACGVSTSVCRRGSRGINRRPWWRRPRRRVRSYLSAYIHRDICICTCVCVCVCVCACVCVSIHVHTCIHMIMYDVTGQLRGARA